MATPSNPGVTGAAAVTVTAALLATVLGVSASAARAQDGRPQSRSLDERVLAEDEEYVIPDIEVEAHGYTLELSQLLDYELMAELDGLDISDLLDLYHWQIDFSRVVTELADANPDQYTGAGVAPDRQSGWIAFAGAVPEGASSLVAELERPVHLIGHRGFSEAELAQFLEDHYYPILEHPDVVDAHGTSDPETGEITITAELDPDQVKTSGLLSRKPLLKSCSPHLRITQLLVLAW